MSTDTIPANEEVLRFLEIYAGRTSVDPEDIYTVVTMRDGDEYQATLRVSHLNQILAERREAVEFVSAFAQGFSEDHILGAAARHFLASIESDA